MIRGETPCGKIWDCTPSGDSRNYTPLNIITKNRKLKNTICSCSDFGTVYDPEIFKQE